jgi:hypothetical protein
MPPRPGGQSLLGPTSRCSGCRVPAPPGAQQLIRSPQRRKKQTRNNYDECILHSTDKRPRCNGLHDAEEQKGVTPDSRHGLSSAYRAIAKASATCHQTAKRIRANSEPGAAAKPFLTDYALLLTLAFLCTDASFDMAGRSRSLSWPGEHPSIYEAPSFGALPPSDHHGSHKMAHSPVSRIAIHSLFYSSAGTVSRWQICPQNRRNPAKSITK